MTTMDPVLLYNFFRQVTKALNGVEIDGGSMTRAEIRSLLLDVQLLTLSQVVAEYNNNNDNNNKKEGQPRPVSVQDVQAWLKNIDQFQQELQQQQQQQQQASDNNHANEEAVTAIVNGSALEAMNEAARLTFARLVLYSGLIKEQQQSEHESTKKIPSTATTTRPRELERKDILEFCGLCQSALRIPLVQQHLQNGTPLIHLRNGNSTNNNNNNSNSSSDNDSSLSPHERLVHIQHLLFQELGHEDAEFAAAQLKRLLVFVATEHEPGTVNDNDNSNLQQYANDAQVLEAVEQLVTTTSVAMATALQPPPQQQKQQEEMPLTNTNMANGGLSDVEQGGVTRVVAVHHSETIVDPQTGKPQQQQPQTVGGAMAAPARESMEQQQEQQASLRQQQQKQQNEMHVAAANLQHEIYQELLHMTEDERDRKLQEAQDVTQQFLQQVATKPPGPERIAYLQSMDESTQRLMIMQKLWAAAASASSASSS